MLSRILAGDRAASARRVGLELVIIVAGVLIALSFDGLVEWRREQKLVREARENLTQEIRENRERLHGSLESNLKHRKDVANGLAELDRLIAAGSGEHTVRAGLSSTQLRQSSWDTAQSTGAIRHMSYAEVKTYTLLYDMQRDWGRIQNRLIDQWMDVMDWRKVRIEGLSQHARDERRRDHQLVVNQMYAVREQGQHLIASYDAVLAGKRF